MRQLLYISSSRPAGTRIDVTPILAQSRRNNASVGVTGLLYTDGIRFLQVLEGEQGIVGETFERIRRDPRHNAIVILHDRTIAERQFGEWAMARRQLVDSDDAFDRRMEALLENASESVRGTFLGLVAARNAA